MCYPRYQGWKKSLFKGCSSILVFPLPELSCRFIMPGKTGRDVAVSATLYWLDASQRCCESTVRHVCATESVAGTPEE